MEPFFRCEFSRTFVITAAASKLAGCWNMTSRTAPIGGKRPIRSCLRITTIRLYTRR